MFRCQECTVGKEIYYTYKIISNFSSIRQGNAVNDTIYKSKIRAQMAKKSSASGPVMIKIERALRWQEAK